mmetsp:Transcript_77262/g.136218  ORF Transcript_77262/g.136218 Transcript_77262/m.136218 type:complete len:224 (-) Transcript_77262:2699-3370(-)
MNCFQPIVQHFLHIRQMTVVEPQSQQPEHILQHGALVPSSSILYGADEPLASRHNMLDNVRFRVRPLLALGLFLHHLLIRQGPSVPGLVPAGVQLKHTLIPAQRGVLVLAAGRGHHSLVEQGSLPLPEPQVAFSPKFGLHVVKGRVIQLLQEPLEVVTGLPFLACGPGVPEIRERDFGVVLVCMVHEFRNVKGLSIVVFIKELQERLALQGVVGGGLAQAHEL